MVTFKIIYKNEKEIQYEYYPEDNKNSVAGLIKFDMTEGTTDVLQPAERDTLRIIPAEDLNAMRDAINEMREENGVPLLTEEELPTVTEDCRYYQYASHVMEKICDAYENGQILKDGMAAWY